MVSRAKLGGGIKALLAHTPPPSLASYLSSLEALFGSGGASCLPPVREVPIRRDQDNCYGAGEICVAVESLLFLQHVAASIEEPLQRISPRMCHVSVEAFYADCVGQIEGLREAMCRRLPVITMRMEDIVQAITAVR